MKFITSSVEYLPQDKGLEGVFKQIELCGRTAYKSEDKITKDSAEPFVSRMVKSNHGAVLEHGTVYLQREVDFSDSDYLDMEEHYLTYDPHSAVALDNGIIYITTNYRSIEESRRYDDLKYICEPTEFHEKRYTLKFICSRGISHELVRHRTFSFIQESQRYCAYDKGKFGKEITFILPIWYIQYKHDSFKLNSFDKILEQIEDLYMFYRDSGMPAEEARDILPNCTKTEICMTGFSMDWRHLLDLRLFEKTGKVHPDMLDLMQRTKNVMQHAGIWDDIMSSYSKFD